MAVQLPNLPYAEYALEPHYSAKTFSFHHGKHHKAYVDNLNKLIAGTPFESKSLEEMIMSGAGDSSRIGMFNNAAQVWNHTFFWNCMNAGRQRVHAAGADLQPRPASLAALPPGCALRHARDFGGVRYLFCRGLDGNAASSHGIHAHTPPQALIDALDALFAGGTP